MIIKEDSMVLISGLCREYEAVFLLDLKTQKITSYYMCDSLAKKLKYKEINYEDYSSIFREYIEKYVHFDDRNRLREINRLDYLHSRVQLEKSYCINYRSCSNGYMEYLQLSIAGIGEEMSYDKILLTFRNIDSQIRLEQKRQKLLEEQLELIEGLSVDYTGMFLVDWDTDEVGLYRFVGNKSELAEMISERGVLSEALSMYIKNVVHPEDQAFMEKETSFEFVRTILKNRPTHRIRFRRMFGNGVAYAEMDFFRAEKHTGKQQIVLAVRNITEVVECQNILKDALECTKFLYENIYFVNLEEGYFRMIYPDVHNIDKIGDYRKALEEYFVQCRIVNEDKDKIKSKLLPKSLRAALMDNDTVEYHYQRLTSKGLTEWCLISVAVRERKIGIPVSVTLAIRSLGENVM